MKTVWTNSSITDYCTNVDDNIGGKGITTEKANQNEFHIHILKQHYCKFQNTQRNFDKAMYLVSREAILLMMHKVQSTSCFIGLIERKTKTILIYKIDNAYKLFQQ